MLLFGIIVPNTIKTNSILLSIYLSVSQPQNVDNKIGKKGIFLKKRGKYGLKAGKKALLIYYLLINDYGFTRYFQKKEKI